MKIKHTPEPWHAGGYEVQCDDGTTICNMSGWKGEGVTKANARRIVACVNACEGIGTEELELCKLSSLDAVHKFLGFKKEHDELLAALEALYRDYVQVMEAGRDRIMDLGGHCDPIDVMERGDPRLIEARKAIAKAKGGAA